MNLTCWNCDGAKAFRSFDGEQTEDDECWVCEGAGETTMRQRVRANMYGSRFGHILKRLI